MPGICENFLYIDQDSVPPPAFGRLRAASERLGAGRAASPIIPVQGGSKLDSPVRISGSMRY